MRRFRRNNLRTVIMTAFATLLLSTFLIMGVVFNIGVNEFIRRQAESLLNVAVTVSEENHTLPEMPDGSVTIMTQNRYSDLRIFITDKDYRLPENHPLTNDATKSIAEQLKNEAVPLDGLHMRLVRTGESRYYVSALKVQGNANSGGQATSGGQDSYVVYYVNVTGLYGFAGMVNILLLSLAGFIWVLASAVTTVLSGTITRPIRVLSAYAKQIGGGKFAPNNMYFNSVEFEELNQSLNQTAKQLAQYDNDQKTFFQNVSHELRTPLMSIKCYAEGINCGVMEAEAASATILAETDRLTAMVDDILYISRLDSLTLAQIKEPTDMSKLAAECVNQHRAVAESKKINLLLETDSNAKQVNCAQKHVARAINNLISNALRYAETAVTVTCVADNASVTVMVRDDGPGVAPEEMPHIYERFYKGKNGLSGIGLSMVKSITEQHGGTVEAYNTEKGAAFTIIIPK